MKNTSIGKELLNFALIVIFIVLPIRFFVAQPFVVVGTSMEPTFLNNEYLIVDELTYHLANPARGQVVVFKYHSGEDDQKYFIKRIIALPGETIQIRDKKVTIFNKSYPEGLVLDEPYVKEPPTNDMTVTLKDDQYFVMGDNRGVSFDSRSWGPLEKDDLVGKVFVRLLPLNKADLLPGAGHYANETK